LRAQSTLTVAAAANLGPALREISARFEKQSGIHVALVFGSSGNLTTQIEHGAPYDAFLSADVSYPEQLAREGLGERESVRRYAVGKLVLWVKKDSHIDLDRLGERALLAPEVRKIAIANPVHAPYGTAAMKYLKSSNLYDELKDKLVMGEDVAQAAQFVISGNAQIGIIPLSLALAPNMVATGRYHPLPKTAPSVEQGAIVITKSADKSAAEKFLEFMKSPDAVGILRRYGYEVPESKP
jgi:molybdate transport system substrate-binding protein